MKSIFWSELLEARRQFYLKTEILNNDEFNTWEAFFDKAVETYKNNIEKLDFKDYDLFKELKNKFKNMGKN